MRFLLNLAAALLAGSVVGAAQQGAEVYILQSDSRSFPDSAPRIPREVARHILLQRAARDRYGISLHDVPETIDDETVISHINTYSRAPSPLFSEPEANQPSQLVMILQGINAENERKLKKALGDYKPAFVVSDPPSYEANDRLIREFNVIGVPAQPEMCAVESAVNPFEPACWKASSSVARYDLAKRPGLVQDLVDNIPRLTKFVQNGNLEAALVLLPESSRSSPLDSWTTSAPNPPADLRRRTADSEAILADGGSNNVSAKPGTPHIWAARKSIPSCFQSFTRCETETNKCSGHGRCADKYENDTRTNTTCFSCFCLASVDHREGDRRSTTHWGGNMCQKIDVSAPFWLIAGFTVTIVGAVTFAVGLLYSVGEEQLPGVIGAGVSRSK